MRRAAAVASALVTLALSACASSSKAVAPTTTPSATAPAVLSPEAYPNAGRIVFRDGPTEADLQWLKERRLIPFSIRRDTHRVLVYLPAGFSEDVVALNRRIVRAEDLGPIRRDRP